MVQLLSEVSSILLTGEISEIQRLSICDALDNLDIQMT